MNKDDVPAHQAVRVAVHLIPVVVNFRTKELVKETICTRNLESYGITL